WEPRAGILFPERCIAAHLEMARRHGAAFRFDEPVISWAAEGEGVRVVTSKEEYFGERLILTAGAWMSQLLPSLKLPLTVERQVLFWFEPTAPAEYFDPKHCPIYMWEHEPNRFIYGFPNLGEGVKIGIHHEGETADPDSIRREVDSHDLEAMRIILRRLVPALDTNPSASVVCMYTNTPDFHFLIDFHPEYSQVLVASVCSGHGFKFASVVGEILTDLLIEGHSQYDLSLFRLSRLHPSE
ncbi:MAG: N-methyl-L-tryptophan oxidase, partial [candidate division KSB1 bacterium]|nr:N-methyl-L-tryptophan oxidase [candidate division KSB1 bacterium]